MAQTITRIGTFDYGHRVINEKFKCYNLHGHTGKYELTFAFEDMQDIGYALDFKEIKRIGCQWIDDVLDHGFISNPKDVDCIEAANKTGSKLWLMSLNGAGEYCNPTAENISKEIFLAMQILFAGRGLEIDNVRLYETPNCFVDCNVSSITQDERCHWLEARRPQVAQYAAEKGIVQYDDRE